MGEPPVLSERTPDGVLVLTLNRPEARNAWNVSLVSAPFQGGIWFLPISTEVSKRARSAAVKRRRS